MPSVRSIGVSPANVPVLIPSIAATRSQTRSNRRFTIRFTVRRSRLNNSKLWDINTKASVPPDRACSTAFSISVADKLVSCAWR